MPPPQNRGPAREVGTGFEPIEALLVDQLETELREAETDVIVAKPAGDNGTQDAIGVGRRIAVAMLGTQVRHSQYGKAPQIPVNLESRRRELREDFHRDSP